jgi:hypothetical protein
VAGIQRAILVIADIGGYTRFMKVHQINLSHAQYVVSRLLEAVIDGAGKSLELTKLEGDAAFFYAPVRGDVDGDDLVRRLGEIRRAFVERRQALAVDRLCNCDGCLQVGDLKLKFVAHVGDVALQKVKRWVELAGMDVILVHRMLKNHVPIAEYVLVTDTVHERLSANVKARASAQNEDFEGVGEVATHWLALDELGTIAVPARPTSFLRKIWQWIRMTFRSLPYMVGAREPCAGFKNLDEALGKAA